MKFVYLKFFTIIICFTEMLMTINSYHLASENKSKYLTSFKTELKREMLKGLRSEIENLVVKLKEEKFPNILRLNKQQKQNYIKSEKYIQENILDAYQTVSDHLKKYEIIVNEKNLESKRGLFDSKDIIDQIKENLELIQTMKKNMIKNRSKVKNSFNKLNDLYDQYSNFDDKIKQNFNEEMKKLKKQTEESTITDRNIDNVMETFKSILKFSERLTSDGINSKQNDIKRKAFLNYQNHLTKLKNVEEKCNETRRAVEGEIKCIIDSKDKFSKKSDKMENLQQSLLRIAKVNKKIIEIKKMILNKLKNYTANNLKDIKNLISNKSIDKESKFEKRDINDLTITNNKSNNARTNSGKRDLNDLAGSNNKANIIGSKSERRNLNDLAGANNKANIAGSKSGKRDLNDLAGTNNKPSNIASRSRKRDLNDSTTNNNRSNNVASKSGKRDLNDLSGTNNKSINMASRSGKRDLNDLEGTNNKSNIKASRSGKRDLNDLEGTNNKSNIKASKSRSKDLNDLKMSDTKLNIPKSKFEKIDRIKKMYEISNNIKNTKDNLKNIRERLAEKIVILDGKVSKLKDVKSAREKLHKEIAEIIEKKNQLNEHAILEANKKANLRFYEENSTNSKNSSKRQHKTKNEDLYMPIPDSDDHENQDENEESHDHTTRILEEFPKNITYNSLLNKSKINKKEHEINIKEEIDDHILKIDDVFIKNKTNHPSVEKENKNNSTNKDDEKKILEEESDDDDDEEEDNDIHEEEHKNERKVRNGQKVLLANEKNKTDKLNKTFDNIVDTKKVLNNKTSDNLEDVHKDIVSSLADAKEHHSHLNKVYKQLKNQNVVKEEVELHKTLTDKIRSSERILKYLENLAIMSKIAMSKIEENKNKTALIYEDLKIIMIRLENMEDEINEISYKMDDDNDDEEEGKEESKHEHDEGKNEVKEDGKHEGKEDEKHEVKEDGKHEGKEEGKHEGKENGKHDSKEDGKHEGKVKLDQKLQINQKNATNTTEKINQSQKKEDDKKDSHHDNAANLSKHPHVHHYRYVPDENEQTEDNSLNKKKDHCEYYKKTIENLRSEISKLSNLYISLKRGSVDNYMRNEVLEKIVNLNSSILDKSNIDKLRMIAEYHKK